MPWKARTVPGFPPFATLPLFFPLINTKHTLKLQSFPCSISRAFPTCTLHLSPVLFLLPLFYPLFGSTSSFLLCTLQLCAFEEMCAVPKAAFPSVTPVGQQKRTYQAVCTCQPWGKHSRPVSLQGVWQHSRPVSFQGV